MIEYGLYDCIGDTQADRHRQTDRQTDRHTVFFLISAAVRLTIRMRGY